MNPDMFEDDGFEDFLREVMASEFEKANGDFRLVMEDEIIFGLGYSEALDRAKQAIAAAGYTVWDKVENGWTVEYFVEDDPENDLVLFATVESEEE